MKFIKEEHYMGNDEDSLKLCEKEIAEDNRYFDEVVRNCFTKKFVTEYFKLHGFHDWMIQSVQNQFDGKSSTVLVELFDSFTKQVKTLKYINVKCFRCDFNETHFADIRHDEYGVDEFYKIGDKHFSHEVLCPSGSCYYIEFQKISIV